MRERAQRILLADGTSLVKDGRTPPSSSPMTTALRPAPNAYAVLLARYVAGEIAESALDAVCSAIDDTEATSDERLAFARFYLDALAAGESDLALPRADEVADVLQIARA